MSTPASSIPAAIRDRISAPAQPRVWTPEDFADLGPRTAVDQALHRLVASRSLRRIARGFYDTPQDNRLTGKPTYPNPRDVIDALARKGKVRVVVDGLTAANDLGLTDAVPARIGVLTDGRLRPITLGNLTLDFQAAAPSRLYWAGRPAMRFRAGAPLAARHASVRRRKPPQAPCLHPQRPRSWTGHSGRLAQRPVGAAGVDADDRARPAPAGERWSAAAVEKRSPPDAHRHRPLSSRSARGSSSR
jgi:hypothetical protein